MYTSFKQPLLNYCSLMVLFHWLHCSKQPLMWYFSIGCTALNSLSYGTFPLAVLLYTLYSLSYGTFPLAALLYTASHMVLFHWLHCSIQPLIWYFSIGCTALYSLSYGTCPLAELCSKQPLCATSPLNALPSKQPLCTSSYLTSLFSKHLQFGYRSIGCTVL